MTDRTNHVWILASRPQGTPAPEDFELVERDVDQPGPGEVRVRTLYLSVDPYIRGMLGGTHRSSDGWPVGDELRGHAVGEVVDAAHPDWQPGDVVRGRLAWGTYTTVPADDLERVDPELGPVSTAVGILGMPGRTAYFGMREIAKPRADDTVVVSGAAGAVGSAAAQIAKLGGCRVVGTAGSDRKCAWLRDTAGIDDAINYRTKTDLGAALDRSCPDGVDVYFDNVGGPITDAVFPRLNRYCRVAVCGQIALYNAEETPVGPRKLRGLIRNRGRVQGFLVGDFDHRAREAEETLSGWIDDGRLAYEETVTEGIETAVEAFLGLFEGENLGKQLVKVGEPSTDR